jgi:hypothetical protein
MNTDQSYDSQSVVVREYRGEDFDRDYDDFVRRYPSYRETSVIDNLRGREFHRIDKCIALLRAAARLTPSPPSAPLRRGLKQRVLDMALGDLLPDTRSGGSDRDQRLDVRPRTGDLVDRGAWVALVV